MNVCPLMSTWGFLPFACQFTTKRRPASLGQSLNGSESQSSLRNLRRFSKPPLIVYASFFRCQTAPWKYSDMLGGMVSLCSFAMCLRTISEYRKRSPQMRQCH
jgi:hypothetical protein